MITKRNLICVKAKNNLDIGRLLLYEPYKNILLNLKDLCVDTNAKDFDPVAKVYDGLLSVPSNIREYYEALLGVTSYYHHSKGGKGTYIEKKLASSIETCSPSIELSEFPFWLEHPILYRKKGIFTQQGLSQEEKRVFRTNKWDWIGNNKDVNIDVGSFLIDERAIILIEVKNRVDSGGTAGRREIWTSEKFGTIIGYIGSNEKLFRKEGKEFSLVELMEMFGIENLQIYIGVLFDIRDSPATIASDKANGFYSSSKQGFQDLLRQVAQSSTMNLIAKDDETLQMSLSLTYSDLKLTIGALYGDDVTLHLFKRKFPVSDLLLLKYDDIWLSLLTTIDERTILLKHQKNYMLTLLDLLKSDLNLRIKYDALINSECEETKLNEVVDYLLDKYSDKFENKLLPNGKEEDGYLADVIQVLCACEA